jgi:tetratricopeptide (TPR) repeat protein
MESGDLLEDSIHEENASNHLALGRIYSSTHRYDLAFDHFSVALTLDSSLVEAFYFRGICLWRMGQFQAALADFMLAADLGWSRKDVWNVTSYIRFRMGDYLGAIADLEHLFEKSSVSLRELLFTANELDTLKNYFPGVQQNIS